VLRALANFRRLHEKVERVLRERGDYYRRNLGEYNGGRDCLDFMREIGLPGSEAETLARVEKVFNRVRAEALAILGEPRPTAPLPLARFMGRRALV
jgi:hypothetical protein